MGGQSAVVDTSVFPVTEVGGVPVLRVDAVKSPLSIGAEAQGLPPIHYTNTVRVVLADGTELFGCLRCGFTDPKRGVIQSHITSAHNGGRRNSGQAKAVRRLELALDMSLRELLEPTTDDDEVNALRREVETLRQRVEELRSRATQAERELAAYRKSLAGLGALLNGGGGH